MMGHLRSLKAVLMLHVCILVLTGCAGTRPSTFYLLESKARLPEERNTALGSTDIGLGVGPVNIPEYLNQPQIVTRTDQNKLELSEFNRWAGSLEENFTRALTENLSTMLNTGRVYAYPWNTPEAVDYQVAVNVTRFDAQFGGDAVLDAAWSIESVKEGGKILLTKKSTLTEPVRGNDYDAVVRAYGEVAAELGRQIAIGLRSVVP